MPDQNHISNALFRSFYACLGAEFVALANSLHEPFDKDGFHLIDRGYLFDFSVFKPKKKITKKQYRELLIIYCLCWMGESLESLSNDKSQNANLAILGTVIFYAELMGHDSKIDKSDFEMHQKRILKVLNEYSRTDILPYVKVVAELDVKGNVKPGFAIVQLLNYFMEFEALA